MNTIEKIVVLMAIYSVIAIVNCEVIIMYSIKYFMFKIISLLMHIAFKKNSKNMWK